MIPVHPILPKRTLLIYICLKLLKESFLCCWIHCKRGNEKFQVFILFQMILTDCTNKRLYLSSDEGLTWSRIDIPFPPDTLVLHPSEPGWILGFSLFDMQVRVKKLISFSWKIYSENWRRCELFWQSTGVIIWS